MSSSPVDTAILEDLVLNQKQVLAMASKTIEMPQCLIGNPTPVRNPAELWAKAKRNITIRRKISQHFLPRSVSVSIFSYLNRVDIYRAICRMAGSERGRYTANVYRQLSAIFKDNFM